MRKIVSKLVVVTVLGALLSMPMRAYAQEFVVTPQLIDNTGQNNKQNQQQTGPMQTNMWTNYYSE